MIFSKHRFEIWNATQHPLVHEDGGGTVTNVASGTGLTGGPITTTGTLSLANTAVTPGSYTSANITVDAQGRITAAASGSGGGANTALSNLIATSINQSLIPNTDTTRSLGAFGNSWLDAYVANLKTTSAGDDSISVSNRQLFYSGTPKLEWGSAFLLAVQSIYLDTTYVPNFWGGPVTSITVADDVAPNPLFIGTRDTSQDANATAALVLNTGDNTAATPTQGTGNIFFFTGYVTNPGVASGAMQMGTGDAPDGSGSIAFSTGSSNVGASGPFLIKTGSGVAGTGDLSLSTGDASGGNSGNLNIRTGTASGIQGTVNLLPELRIEGTTSGYVGQRVPAAPTSYTVVWPSAQGGAGEFLQNDGSGNLSWAAAGGGGQIAASARLGTNFTIVDGASDVEIILDTVVGDTNPGAFDDTTGRYTVQVSEGGWYSVEGQLSIFMGAIATDFILAGFTINGAGSMYGLVYEDTFVALKSYQFVLQGLIELAAGDYVSIRVYNDGQDVTAVGDTGDDYTYMHVHKV